MRARGHGSHRRLLEAGLAYPRGRGEFELLLANAAHGKNVPGRKTDVNDAAFPLRVGRSRPHPRQLRAGSFVPDRPTQELRSLLGARKQRVRERSSHTQRLQKTLKDGNIKLNSVISDILGVSGRAMIEAMIAGQTDPAVLAGLADRRIKAKGEELREALARPPDNSPSLLAPTPSRPDRRPRAGDRADRRGGEERSRTPFARPSRW